LVFSEFLAIESEISFLRLLLDLDLNPFEVFGCIEVSFLSKEGLTLFLSEVSFDDLCEDVWLKTKLACLQQDSSVPVRSRRYHRLLDSVFLEGFRNAWENCKDHGYIALSGFAGWFFCFEFSRQMRWAVEHHDND
jgi:hypothetical protein